MLCNMAVVTNMRGLKRLYPFLIPYSTMRAAILGMSFWNFQISLINFCEFAYVVSAMFCLVLFQPIEFYPLFLHTSPPRDIVVIRASIHNDTI